MIIGVTGYSASGKDTVVDYLVSKGFTKVSGGDILREEMIKLGLPTDRTSIHTYVEEKRRLYGNAYVAEKTIEKVNEDTAISGVRNIEEVKKYREVFGSEFRLIAIDSPIEVRYERAKERGRLGDEVSFEKFKEEQDYERTTDTGSFSIELVIKDSDIQIVNDGSLDDLYRKVDNFIKL
jgi:dephospho-CoA kinase